MTRLLAVLGVIRSTGGAVRPVGVTSAEAALAAFDANPASFAGRTKETAPARLTRKLQEIAERRYAGLRRTSNARVFVGDGFPMAPPEDADAGVVAGFPG